MTNTEKPTTKDEQKKQGIVNTQKMKEQVTTKNTPPSNDPKQPNEQTKDKETPKEKIITKPKVKKTEAVINALSLPISTKQSMAICKFIKRKEIDKAIADLEQVSMIKKAVPMKGEIPHRKGKGISSGRFPKKAAEQFIKVLKSLSANVNVNELNNPVISEAIANMASRPHGKSGRVRKKRTHVKIIAREKKSKNNPKEKKKEKKEQ